jgi:hypothetical protein
MIVYKVKVFPDSRILITPICDEPMVMVVVWFFLMTTKDGGRKKRQRVW